MNMKKLVALLLAACMLLGLLAGCTGGENTDVQNPDASQDAGAADGTEGTGDAGAQAGEPKYGGHLNVAVAGSMAGWDPHTHPNVWTYMFLGAVFNNPLTRDADNNIAPDLCDFELSEDRRTIKLWVREGMKFQDGSDVEITDVEASIKRACEVGNTVKEYLAPAIESMVVEGENLTIKFNCPSERPLSRLAAYQIWLAVLPKEICEANPSSDLKDVSLAIGTGPYKITDFVAADFVELERWEDYVVRDEGKTGYAGPKYGYLDSMTFYQNSDYSSITMGLLSKQYDVTDVVEAEYRETMAAEGIIRSNFGRVLTTYTGFFNNSGGNNVCAKYPELRKAVMAAINMYEVADVITDEACVVDGGSPCLDERYQTTYYADADWFGEDDQDVVDKYLEEAKAKGYDDEPVQLVSSSASNVFTMVSEYLEDAGINYKWNFMDANAASEFLADGQNNWDIKFDYVYGGYTPTTLPEEYESFFYVSEERDKLVAELLTLEEGSDEYIAKWQELHKLEVEDCSIIHFGFLDWYWNHVETLHCDFEGPSAYFFNAYWEDPENHTK